MHISGLVVTFRDDPDQAHRAMLEIASAGPFQLGESFDRTHAVVMETTDPGTAHDWHDWANALSGVEHIEVVFVHWDDAETEVAHANA